MTSTDWSDYTDLAQHSLEHYFGAAQPQLINNTYPVGDNETFNYWWLAHAIDARLDAYARTGNQEWLTSARELEANLRSRNGDSLFNDYFDDMLWYALALLRLADATGEAAFADDARAIHSHVVEHGWNSTLGWSLAWRKQQLYYKNTPANGPFVILSARLFERDPNPELLGLAVMAFDWLNRTMVAPDGFIEDGINRNEDGALDTQWRFSYNQGLYIGAALALAKVTTLDLTPLAVKTALAAIAELAPDGVIASEGSGGDEGLFKGVFYRYLALLIDELEPESQERAQLESFVRTSTDALIASSLDQGRLLAGADWRTQVELPVHYSTQLSAIMALEVRTSLEGRSR